MTDNSRVRDDMRHVEQRPHTQTSVFTLRREQPQIMMSWASMFPKKFDKLKLRKRLKVWPVRITLKAEFDTTTNGFDYGWSIKVRTSILSLSGKEKLFLFDSQADFGIEFNDSVSVVD